jgi:DNA-directed RNA polymerase specialized sigma24 family protein
MSRSDPVPSDPAAGTDSGGGDSPMEPLDRLFEAVCDRDESAFEAWMVAVELPVRRVLEPWARAVDVESVAQETFMRMWVFAADRGRTLTGRHASLRFAVGMARNLARNEARRFRREHLVARGPLPEPPVEPDPPPDPGLARIIRRCLESLAPRPLAAIRARMEEGHLRPDAALADALGMGLNTFLQNIVRGRRQLASCLERNGAPIEEILG